MTVGDYILYPDIFAFKENHTSKQTKRKVAKTANVVHIRIKAGRNKGGFLCCVFLGAGRQYLVPALVHTDLD